MPIAGIVRVAAVVVFGGFRGAEAAPPTDQARALLNDHRLDA